MTLPAVGSEVNACNTEPKTSEDSITVYSTEFERHEFNQWYYNQVDNVRTSSMGSRVEAAKEVTKVLFKSTPVLKNHHSNLAKLASEFHIYGYS